MCLMTFINALKPSPKISLLHPEEMPDYSQTCDGIYISKAIDGWLTKWDVPAEYHDYWRASIVINVSNDMDNPAQSWGYPGSLVRYIDIKPAYLNAGVIAHEQAHNSYALLTDEQKELFAAEYLPLIKSDPYIKLLYSVNNYGLTSIIEGHAEVYRYIGANMPETLKSYYPKLFNGGENG